MEGVYDTATELPIGWTRKRLGDVLTVIRGASPRPKGDPRYFGGTIPWVMISDITKEKGKFLSQTRDHVTQAGAEKSR
jgi:type I restriction enzyme, S subunit